MPEAPKPGLSGQNIDIGTYTAEVHYECRDSMVSYWHRDSGRNLIMIIQGQLSISERVRELYHESRRSMTSHNQAEV
jgi:hypothetical protein